MAKLPHFLILLSILTSAAQSKESNSTLFLKNGAVVEMNIAMVYSRHVTDDSGKGVLLWQMDSVHTTDESVARLFMELDSSIAVEKRNGDYSISMGGYIPPMHYHEHTRVLTPFSVGWHFRSDPYGNLGFQYDGIILEQWSIIHRLQASIAFKQGQDVFSNLNLALGVGCRKEYERLAVECVVNYGVYGGTFDKEQLPGIQNVLFLSPGITYQLFGPIQMHAGVDYFVYRQHPRVPYNTLVPYAGINYQL